MKETCDVIIPVHGQPHWVALCVDELIRNTPADALGKILLVDDDSDAVTKFEMERVAAGHSAIRVLSLSARKGFAHAVNRGLEETTADYVLLLNTDCLLTRNLIPKLIAHAKRDSGVGMVSPFSNNSPPLTLEMPAGYSYHRTNELLERTVPGVSMEACTIVGNALLIARPCLNKTGLFDPEYGLGYGEETDYQFRAMRNGLIAVAALDSYVYHKGAESFSADRAGAIRIKAEGRERFFSRWRADYDELSRRVPPDRPRQFILKHLTETELWPCVSDAMFVLPNVDQRVGGCHVVVDICNAATRAGMNVQIVSLMDRSYMSWHDPLFVQPIFYSEERDFVEDNRFQPRAIVATAWHTELPCKLRADALGSASDYFVQGYESYFSNGSIYGAVEDTFQYADRVLTTSEWLKNMVAAHYSGPITVLPLGYNERVFNTLGREVNAKPRITIALRGSIDKGQPVLLELTHRLSGHKGRFDLTVLTKDEVFLPSCWVNECEVHKLPLRNTQVSAILKRTDVFVDASLHEGFGLMPLEALACGCAVIVSDSGGVAEFVRDGANGFVISEVNRPDRYVEKVELLLDDPKLLRSLQERAAESVTGFAGECRLRSYTEYLERIARERGPAPRKAIEARSLAIWTRALTRIRGRVPAPFPGLDLGAPGDARQELSGIEARIADLEKSVSDIQQSRIWRTLRAGAAAVMFVSTALRWAARLGRRPAAVRADQTGAHV